MIPTFENELFSVWDNFLSPAEFQSFWEFFNQIDFRHKRGGLRLNNEGLGYEDLLQSNLFLSEKLQVETDHVHCYPTGTPMDLFVEKAFSCEKEFEPWVGLKEKNWKWFNLTPFVYAEKTLLPWHTDFGNKVAAMTFYAHPSWHSTWGGELFVAGKAKGRIADRPPSQKVPQARLLERPDELQQVTEPGIGHFILPKPNRLVVIGRDVIHSVRQTDPAAGDNLRCTVTGFFLSPWKWGAESLFSQFGSRIESGQGA